MKMAKASSTLVTSPNKAYEFEEDYYPQNPYKSNARSLIAFLSSMLFYTSIFYIFNLSPSSLFYNTKFWFLISNTLILIIAADYSSSKHDQISYQDEYMMHRQPQVATSSFVQEKPSQIGDISNHRHQFAHRKIETFIKEEHEQEVSSSSLCERKKSSQKRSPHMTITIPRNGLVSNQMFGDTWRNQKDEHDDEKPSDEVDVRTKWIVHVQPKVRKRKNARAKIYKRSKSEEVRRVADVDECKTITRSKTLCTEEENEYATMSNEELNRRSEEFIRRFNEQIRRQSDADRRLRLVYYDDV